MGQQEQLKEVAPPDWSQVFQEPVTAWRQIDAGYANANEIWEVTTEKGVFIVRVPKASFGRPRHPFWNGLYRLFNLHIHVDIEGHRALARFIAQHTPLKIPHVRAIDTSGELVPRPFTVVDRLPGSTADFGRSADPAGLARDLGHHLGSLHRARFEYWGVFEGSPRFTPEEWPQRLSQTLSALRGREGAETDKVEAALPGFEEQARALAPPSHLTLVFPDLRPSQFLEEDGRLTALVDIDSMVVGPRELDLIAMEYSLTPALLQPFVDGYTAVQPLPDVSGVRPLYRFLYYLVDTLGRSDYDQWMQHESFF